MNAGRDVERLIATWLVEEAPGHAPDRILGAAADRIDQTNQRRFLAAWREPVTISTRALAAAVIAIVAVGAAIFFFRPTPPNVGSASPTPAPPGSPSPVAPTVAEFKMARDAICTAAAAQLDPLKERFVGVYEPSITATERADAIAALEQFAQGYEVMITDLEGLTAPAHLVVGQVTNVTQFRSMLISIEAIIQYLREGDDDAARGVDETTDALNVEILGWEAEYNFQSCP